MPIVTTLGALVDLEPSLTRIAGLRFADLQARYHVVQLLEVVQGKCAYYTSEHRRLSVEHGLAELVAGAGVFAQLRPRADAGDAAIAAFLETMEKLRAVRVTLRADALTRAELDACPDATPADLVGLGPLLQREAADVDDRDGYF